jgi:hypothetical protein
VKSPEPLIVSWQRHQVHIRHDDPHLGPYTLRGAVIRSAMELASDVEGLRLFLVTALGERYAVRVADDGSVRPVAQGLIPQIRTSRPMGMKHSLTPWVLLLIVPPTCCRWGRLRLGERGTR